MRMFTGLFEGYKATALQERKKDGWRIRTWHENKDDQGHDYWVQDGQFYAIDIGMPLNTLIGKNVDDTVPPAKREAVLHLIAKWKAEGLDESCTGRREGIDQLALPARPNKIAS